MRRLIAIMTMAFCLLAIERAPMAGSHTIDIKEPWARATPNGATIGVTYMTVINSGTVDDLLLAAATPIAARVEFHSAANVNGVMQMREISTIAIPLGAPITFGPGAMHMMMIGLKQPLKEGQTFAMVLEFEKAGRIDVTVRVASIGAMNPAGSVPP